MVPDAFLRYKSDSYLLLPLLRPSLDQVWHPVSLILYGETMGSGGEELLCEQELKWGDRGSKSRMKTGRERERGRGGGALRREIVRSQYSQNTNVMKRYMNGNSPPTPPLAPHNHPLPTTPQIR